MSEIWPDLDVTPPLSGRFRAANALPEQKQLRHRLPFKERLQMDFPFSDPEYKLDIMQLQHIQTTQCTYFKGTGACIPNAST